MHTGFSFVAAFPVVMLVAFLACFPWAAQGARAAPT